jgi:membrane protein
VGRHQARARRVASIHARSGPRGCESLSLAAARERLADISRRSREWTERQDPGSPSGVAINAWRHYRAVDGPLQSALLSLYVLVAVLPALLVMEEYLDPHPDALANRLVHHYGLNGSTADLIHDVLGAGRAHELGSALLAIAGALFFGLGFGRVLQLVHARSWRLPLPTRQTDQALYAAVLLAVYGLLLLLLVQLTELRGSPSWVGITLAIGWVGLLVLFFVWAPWLLTHKLIARRDLLPGAALTALGLVVLMVASSHVMQFWVDLYARDYGGFGVVLAIYFWIAFSSAIIVAAASLSPALAERRDPGRRAWAEGPQASPRADDGRGRATH